MRPESGFQMAANGHKLEKKIMTSQFADMTSSINFFNIAVFFLSILFTGPKFMSIA